jgi:hypothetical protein
MGDAAVASTTTFFVMSEGYERRARRVAEYQATATGVCEVSCRVTKRVGGVNTQNRGWETEVGRGARGEVRVWMCFETSRPRKETIRRGRIGKKCVGKKERGKATAGFDRCFHSYISSGLTTARPLPLPPPLTSPKLSKNCHKLIVGTTCNQAGTAPARSRRWRGTHRGCISTPQISPFRGTRRRSLR